MSITHHPGEELLLSYASGAANEAVSLLVATHIALCTLCRKAVRAAEAAGGSVLSVVPPAPLASNAYDSILARLDAPAAEIVRKANIAGDVPAPLRSYIGANYSEIRWRPVAPGLSYYPLFTRDATRHARLAQHAITDNANRARARSCAIAIANVRAQSATAR